MAKGAAIRSLGLTSRLGRSSVDTERAQAEADGRWRAIRDRTRLGGRAAPPEEAPHAPRDGGRLPPAAHGYAAPPAQGYAQPAHSRAAPPGHAGPHPTPSPQAAVHDPAVQLLRR